MAVQARQAADKPVHASWRTTGSSGSSAAVAVVAADPRHSKPRASVSFRAEGKMSEVCVCVCARACVRVCVCDGHHRG